MPKLLLLMNLYKLLHTTMFKFAIYGLLLGLILYPKDSWGYDALAKRDIQNAIYAAIGTKKLSFPEEPLNTVGNKNITYLPCVAVGYRRYVSNTVGLGVSFDFCDKAKNDADEHLGQTTQIFALDATLAFPIKNSIISGPFATQSMELGFGGSYGVAKLLWRYRNSFIDEVKENLSGSVLAANVYFEIGTKKHGVLILFKYEEYSFPKLAGRSPIQLSDKVVSKDQSAIKLYLGYRYGF